MGAKAEANFLTVCILFKIPESKICVCRVVIVMIPRKLAPDVVGKAEEIRTPPLRSLRPLAIGEPGTVRWAATVLFALVQQCK